MCVGRGGGVFFFLKDSITEVNDPDDSQNTRQTPMPHRRTLCAKHVCRRLLSAHLAT